MHNHCDYLQQILQLMDRVEDLFTQHLAHESHKQAMVYLRPVQRTSEFVSVSYLQGKQLVFMLILTKPSSEKWLL